MSKWKCERCSEYNKGLGKDKHYLSKRQDVSDYWEQIEKAALTASPLFQFFGWAYFDDDHPATFSQIRNTLKYLVGEVLASVDNCSMSTGHFTVCMLDGEFGPMITIKIDLAEFEL